MNAHASTPGRLDPTGGELELCARTRSLTLRFAAPHTTASWALIGGGLQSARAVVFLQVDERELRPPVDPAAYTRARLAAAGLHDAVALLTSRRLDAHADVTCRHRDLHARCIATVGMGNALRAGDQPGPAGSVGTINLVCQLGLALTSAALLEALALAAAARTLAVREAEIPSRASGLPASGTGTDCIVIAAPQPPARGGRALRYAGMHTALGHVIGAAVLAATQQGIERWRRDRVEAGHG
jgi:adenosylcobinamide amidohydrolase